MTSKEIKRIVKLQINRPKFTDNILADNFPCGQLGMICSIWFIRHNVSPNFVTMLMIIFGAVGSILFAIPDLWCKIAGYLCWVMWYTMDNSDGQVARFSKRFSKYGTHMDLIAHLIDHPLMNLAIWLTLIQISNADIFLISLCSITVISCEMILRNFTTFQYYMGKEGDTKLSDAPSSPNILKYILVQFTLFPNIITLFSWIFIIGYAMDSAIVIYIFYGWTIYFLLCTARQVLKTLMHFYHS